MRIRTKHQLITAALTTALVASTAAMVSHTQRKVLRAQSLQRLEALMEGAARIAKESFDSRDRLMAISYLKFLQKEHPELAFASISYAGHVSRIGAESEELVYLERGASAAATPPDAGEPPAAQGVSVRLGFEKKAVDEEVRRALAPLVRWTLLIAGAFILLGLLISAWVTSLLTGPIEVLAGATAALASGSLDVSVPVSGRDEMGALTRSFNSMSGRIKDLVESREDILHTLTHEINTPLGGLKGYLELWQDQKLRQNTEQTGEIIGTMMMAVLRMENSLSNALALFRSEHKRPPKGALQQVQVAEIFSQTLTMFEPMTRAKNIKVFPLHKAISGRITAYEEPVRQIVVNLVSNAIKYTPEGGQIKVGLHDNPCELMLHVSNSGLGIPAEAIPHLFTKFYRSGEDRDAGKRIPGTGLGLNIVHKAVKALGGQVYVKSKPGETTLFLVRLPKRAENTQDPGAVYEKQ